LKNRLEDDVVVAACLMFALVAEVIGDAMSVDFNAFLLKEEEEGAVVFFTQVRSVGLAHDVAIRANIEKNKQQNTQHHLQVYFSKVPHYV